MAPLPLASPIGALQPVSDDDDFPENMDMDDYDMLAEDGVRRQLWGKVEQQHRGENPFLIDSAGHSEHLSNSTSSEHLDTSTLFVDSGNLAPRGYLSLPNDTVAICTQFFGFPPKKKQIEVVENIALRKDCILVAGCGWGKSLTYFLPLLFWTDRIIVIISPLKALMNEQQGKLQQANINSIAIHGDNIPPSNLEDRLSAGEYRAVFMTPELATNIIRFPRLWNMDGWKSKLLAVIVDEAHCIHTWGPSFRHAYTKIGDLRALVPPGLPFVAMSATLPPAILQTVKASLYFRPDVNVVKADSDRPNIKYFVITKSTNEECLQDMVTVIHDLAKTIVYFDDKKYIKKAHRLFCQTFPDRRRHIVEFMSDLTEEAKLLHLQNFRESKTRILLATDAVGMGCDIPDIIRVIQFKCPETISALSQRLGRAVRNPELQGQGIVYTTNRKNSNQKGDQHLDAFLTTKECRRKVFNTAFCNPHTIYLDCCDICDKRKGKALVDLCTLPPDSSNRLHSHPTSTPILKTPHLPRTSDQQKEAKRRILGWRQEELLQSRNECEFYTVECIMETETIDKLVEEFGSIDRLGAVSSILGDNWEEICLGAQHRLEDILICYNLEITNINLQGLHPESSQHPQGLPQNQPELQLTQKRQQRRQTNTAVEDKRRKLNV